MYNQSIKEEYLQFAYATNPNIIDDLERWFNQNESFEIEHNKDLCCFTVPEIIEIYKNRFTSSLELLMNINSQFGKYTNYCINRNLVPDGQNHYLEIKQDVLITCLNKAKLDSQIMTREQVIDLVNSLENPCESFIILGVFEGLYGKQMVDLTRAEFSQFDGDIIHTFGGRDLNVSKELKHFAEISADTWEYYPYGHNPKREEYLFKTDDNRIVKALYNSNTDTDTANYTKMRNKIARIRDNYDIPGMSYKMLKESGRLDMIRTLMASGSYKTIEDCIKTNQKEIEYRYGKITSFPRWIMKYEAYV